MYRRDFFTTAAAAGGSLALLSALSPARALAAGRNRSARRVSPSLIETRDGTQLFYRDWGSGTPVVFLSGWTLPSDSWSYLMAPLAESGLRCIAYDRRGHGRSSDPGRGYDYDTLADDLADVLEALDLRDLTLVAHSMAGGEAVRYVSRHGSKRIARLALVGTTLPFLTRTADNPDGVDPALFEHLRRNFLLKDYPKWLQDNGRPFVVAETSNEMMNWIRGLMTQCSMQAVVECNRALTSTDFRTELSKLALPTLLVHGDKDVSVPAPISAMKTKKLLTNSTLAIYEGAPHGLMFTHAERLGRDLQQFVRS